ncbi:MAG: TlpA family protein disulfide reductase [Actinomycetota bacterium]
MSVIAIGSPAPALPGVSLSDEPRALFFYKVTCPVCQMAAPVAERLERFHPGIPVGIGQDPPDRLGDFAEHHGWSFPQTPDPPPYEVSDAYGIRVVPTLVLVHDGAVADVVESWDRDGYNRVSSRLTELTGRPAAPISEEGDGLPPFRPG